MMSRGLLLTAESWESGSLSVTYQLVPYRYDITLSGIERVPYKIILTGSESVPSDIILSGTESVPFDMLSGTESVPYHHVLRM